MKEKTGITLIFILYSVGLVCMFISSLKPSVLALTPYTLLISFILLLSSYKWKKSLLMVSVTLMVLGFLVEWLGVKTGWVFGSYAYGSVLGPKLFDVPLIIGVNWAMLALICHGMAHFFVPHQWGSIFLGAALMTGMDFLMEPVAVANGYWHWKDGIIPVYNYVCWFVVAWIANALIHRVSLTKMNNISLVLFLVLNLFFLIQNLT